MDESFGKSEKLKSKKLITQLFSEGKSVSAFPLRLIYVPISRSNHKTGVSVPKRNFRHAVDRNLLKRLLRECFRKNKYILTEKKLDPHAFMIIYVGKKKEIYDYLFPLMKELLQKFVKKQGLEKS